MLRPFSLVVSMLLSYRNHGFTLIELIMVLILVGILAIFVVPNVRLTQGYDAVGYRDSVRATLEYARKSAVAQRRNVKVTVSGNNLELTIANDIPEGASSASFVRGLPLPTPDSRCGGPANRLCAPQGVTLTGPVTLIFSPLGRPSSGAGYIVTGDETWTTTVEAETGHVH